jgi:DUF2075 family protein
MWTGNIPSFAHSVQFSILKSNNLLLKPGPEMARDILKNTFRTLMIRGMKGCYVYCVDEVLGVFEGGSKI